LVFRRQPVDRFFSLRVTITRISTRGTRDRVAQARTTTRLPQVSRCLTTPQGRTAPKSRMHRARRGNCGVHTSVNGEVTTESLNRQVILPLGPRQPPLSSVCKPRLPSLSARASRGALVAGRRFVVRPEASGHQESPGLWMVWQPGALGRTIPKLAESEIRTPDQNGRP